MTSSELVIVMGKGGTGRTTVAAALALGAAGRGRRTVVCEVGGQARVPGLLGVNGARAARGRDAGVERRVADGLWALTIDPEVALREWLERTIPRQLAAPLLRSGAFSAFVGAAPGARELLAITKAWELGQAKRWRRDEAPFDTVVLDAPASGHGLGMLRVPRTYAQIARVGPIASQARTVAAALADPGASRLVGVALPGELPVNETLELDAALERTLGRGLDAIVVNAVWSRRLSGADARRAERLDGAPLRRAVTAATQRVRTQQAQLARLRREAPGRVRTLPFVFADALGAPDVRAFAERLEGDGA